MNQNNFFKKYFFRRDFYWKVKEKIYQFIRNNSRNAFKDQKRLLNNLENGVIVDVGAYLGETTQLYRKYFNKSKIICFEPTIDSQEYLKQRFRNDKSITINGKALASKSTKLSLYISDYPNLNSLRKPNDRAWGFKVKKSYEIETISLDEFYSERKI